MSRPKILLSTTSVFPESTGSAFEIAAEAGFDGVELMVGVDALSLDMEAIAMLSDRHQVPVCSLHAPTLLITQGAWGGDPWEKLQRSAEAAARLGADVVVVHPPFRWQRGYAEGFAEGIRDLNRTSGVTFAVENMFPWRTPAGSLMAYLPDWDPTHLDYDHLTLDLSHASTAKLKSLDLVERWGGRLTHVHLTDGTGSFKDEHLLPGEGDQDAWGVVRELGRRGYAGHIALEVSTRRVKIRGERVGLLGEVLEQIRREVASGVALTGKD
ncbi:MAG: sugar phosphate isomerase/epimerase family protein [Propionibacteriaceae bacterium]|nr:sugar phosphate isomerase/epimerase family protein [Propionibacteriaceae bacterium]